MLGGSGLGQGSSTIASADAPGAIEVAATTPWLPSATPSPTASASGTPSPSSSFTPFMWPPLAPTAAATTAVETPSAAPTPARTTKPSRSSKRSSSKTKTSSKAKKTVAARRVGAASTANNWTGYAFDTCSAPSQRVMSRWLKTSPFSGVGVYLGGIQRACSQPNLTRSWVSTQEQAGWQLLPLWVGPQASCTGFHHRIASTPGATRHYAHARLEGVGQAKLAVRAARRLGIGRGQELFYDLESFDASRHSCVKPALAFLENWTLELHHLGYKSGVYSHISSGIRLLATTPRSYHKPDAVWYAWIDRANARPTKYVSSPKFMAAPRVHQFAIDRPERYGGIRLDIDWNYVSLGDSNGHAPLLKLGSRGVSVRRLQKQLNATLKTHVPVDGSFGKRTAKLVKLYQAHIHAARTSVVTKTLWHSLAKLAN